MHRPLTLLLVDDSETKKHTALNGIEAWAGITESRENPLPKRIQMIRENTKGRVQVILESDPFEAQDALKALSIGINGMITDNQMLGASFAEQMLEAAQAAGVAHSVVYTSTPLADLQTPQIIRSTAEKDAQAVKLWLQEKFGPYLADSANPAGALDNTFVAA